MRKYQQGQWGTAVSVIAAVNRVNGVVTASIVIGQRGGGMDEFAN